MDDGRKQKLLIAGLSVLVLGAGSFYLMAGGSEKPPQTPRVVDKGTPPGASDTATPPREAKDPGKTTKPKRPIIRRERTEHDNTPPQRRPGRHQGSQPRIPKKDLQPAG